MIIISIIALLLFFIVGIFLWFQSQLLLVFNAVNDAIFHLDDLNANHSILGESSYQVISGNILDYLYAVQSDRTQAGELTLSAVRDSYWGDLFMTVGVALLSAIALTVIAYLVAIGIDHLEARGQNKFSTAVQSLFDTLPYIFWSMIGLSIGFAIFSSNPGSSSQYFIFLLSLYAGFGMFLLPFFVQENTRQFRAARHGGVFDGERMSGLSDWRIRLRLLRYRFLGAFVRQILYCAIFMMLFDFSLYGVVSTNQSSYAPTVFVQANIYYQKHYRDAEGRLNAAQSFGYQDLLRAFASQAPTAHSAQSLVKQYLKQSWQILAVSNQRQLQQLIEKDEHPFTITIKEETLDKNDFLTQLSLSKIEQEVIFFKHISNYYIYMNILVLLGLFLTVFLGFDIKRLFQNA